MCKNDSNMDTARKKQLFLENYAKTGFHISKTCKAIGIHRNTYGLWMNNDEEFKSEVEALEEEDIDNSEHTLMLLRHGIPKVNKKGKIIGWAVKPDFRALKLHLEAKAAKRGYGNKLEIIPTKKDGRELTDEELAAAILKIQGEIDDDEWDTSNDGLNDGSNKE